MIADASTATGLSVNGLINSWFNTGCAVELHKTAVKCNRCASCAEACPMGLTRMYAADRDLIYNQKGCIMCFRCVDVCPRPDCLTVQVFGEKVLASRYAGMRQGKR